VACVDEVRVSHKSVEIVIGRLATDEAIRARFAADPAGTLRQLRDSGLDLNAGEMAALLEMPLGLWGVLASWVHPRLQKVAMKGDRHEP
jgi:hypothetical protein